MRRSYDPHYGSREQLRDSAEHGMKVARERDKLKTENDQMTGHIQELQWRIEELTDKLIALEECNNALITANEALMMNLQENTKLIDSFAKFANHFGGNSNLLIDDFVTLAEDLPS